MVAYRRLNGTFNNLRAIGLFTRCVWSSAVGKQSFDSFGDKPPATVYGPHTVDVTRFAGKNYSLELLKGILSRLPQNFVQLLVTYRDVIDGVSAPDGPTACTSSRKREGVDAETKRTEFGL